MDKCAHEHPVSLSDVHAVAFGTTNRFHARPPKGTGSLFLLIQKGLDLIGFSEAIGTEEILILYNLFFTISDLSGRFIAGKFGAAVVSNLCIDVGAFALGAV